MLNSLNSLVNLGDVKTNTVTEGKFSLKNTSGEFINITKVVPSCGCTTSTLNNKKVSPKETISIGFSFDSSNKRGVYTKSITVHYSYHGEEQVLVQKFIVNVL